MHDLNIELIKDEWRIDSDSSKITFDNLATFNSQILEMHYKYWNYLIMTKQDLIELGEKEKYIKMILWKYYSGKTLSDKVIEAFKFKPLNENYGKTELNKFIESDSRYTEINMLIKELEVLRDFLLSILDMLGKWGFLSKNIIDNHKIINGIM